MPIKPLDLQKYEPERFYQGEHRCYKTPEGAFPGVTTILGATKPLEDRKAIEKWQNRVGFEVAEGIKNAAAERGTLTHTAIEDYFTGATINEAENGYFCSIKPFLEKLSKPHLCEGAIWHPDGYAGTLDYLGEHEGELIVADWKTSDRPKRDKWITDYFLQAAAYVRGVNHVYGLNVKTAVIAVAIKFKNHQLFVLDEEKLDRFYELFEFRLETYHDKVKSKLTC